MKEQVIKNALIALCCYIILSVLLYILSLDTNQWLKWIVILLQFGLFFYFPKTYQELLPQQEYTFGSVFKHNAFSTILYVVLVTLFILIYINYIDTLFYDKIIEQTRDKLIEKNLSDEQIETSLAYVKKYTTPIFIIITSVLTNLVTTTIANLLGSAFFTKDQKN